MTPPEKRKRGERTYSQDSANGSNRPSPHRPDNLRLAQPNYPGRGYGRGRGGRGGRGGSYPPSSPTSGPHSQQMRGNPMGTQQMSPPRPPSTTPQGVDASTSATNPKPPTPSASVAVASPPPQAPTRPKLPYFYEYLTNDCVTAWHEEGKASVNAVAAQAISNNDFIVLSTVFQEVIRAGLDSRIETAEAGNLVQEIVSISNSGSELNPSNVFLDTLSIVTEHHTDEPLLSAFVLSTGIPYQLMRELLEEPLLKKLGLIRDNFGKQFIRKQTNILYRQSNYNLLREESEGYSKLMTELFTTTSNDYERKPSTLVVGDTFENIKALIGAFDLDPGRVLDVTLDVFASLLVKHYRFFVKFLRASSWWPQGSSGQTDRPSLGGLPIWANPDHVGWAISEEDKHRLSVLREERDVAFWNQAKKIGIQAFFELGQRKDENLEDESQQAKDISKGSSVAAQLLGFKLRFYASNARDSHDEFPVNLIYLSALLIKIGFVSLKDLYLHLYPADGDMGAVKETQMQAKEERERQKRPGGVANALMKAGALVDDTIPQTAASRLRDAETRSGTPSRTEPASSSVGTPAEKAEESEQKDQLPEPDDQKVQLLRSLLCIGAIPEALYLLGRHPWLPDAFPDLPEHINRILHHCLAKVYKPLRPMEGRDSLRTAAKQTAYDQTGLPKGEIRLTEPPVARGLRWPKLDKNDADAGIDYRFYWDDWADNVPVCQNVDDVFTLCGTLLNFTGVKIGQDTALLLKLARIGKYSLAEDPSDSNTNRWIALCRRLLVPALSLTGNNPGVVNEVYDLLKRFSTQTRYSIYAEWFTGPTSRLPDIQAAFDLARAETKNTLRRISKTNTKEMARQLAKVACASPGVVFAVTLNQLESYDNFVEVIVDCGRYFTYMGYDVLTWSIMTAVGRAGRDRVSLDGISTSPWLMALAKFVGKVYKRYTHMNPVPMLQYVLQQVRQNNFTDLRVLRELIHNMAGIAADATLSDAQVQSMAGGDVLQAQTLIQLMDTRHENKSSAKRLMKALTDANLTDQLLIAIAQERQMCIFNEKQTSLKVIGENFDDIHIVMAQYLDLLRTNMSTKDFDEFVPNIASLINKFGLDPSVAFTIHREGISRAVTAYDAAQKEAGKAASRKLSTDKKDSNGDVEMGEATVSDSADRKVLELDEKDAATNGENAHVQSDDDQTPTSAVFESEPVPPWHPVLRALMEELKPALGSDFEDSMSLPFFVSFWQLSPHDMLAPSTSYNDEIGRQKRKLATIAANRSDVSTTGVQKKEKDKKEVNDLLECLKNEMKAHILSYTDIRHRLMKEKDHWFASLVGKPHTLNSRILQECFLPRLLLSPQDSYFTFRILFFLHGAGTPGFSTMHLIDRLLDGNALTALIFQCTARESENFGRFLYELLKELASWHADKKEYDKKAWGKEKDLPGFSRSPLTGKKPSNLLQFEDFRRLMKKWHVNLHTALKASLGGGEYMHMKNAITILKCVQKVFPVMNFMGTQICDVLNGLIKSEKDSREDLWVAANSLYGSLKARQKDWRLPQAFYISDAPPGQRGTPRPASSQPRSSLQKGGTPQPLNAAAEEFRPKSASSANEARALNSSKGDVEDGELNDTEMVDAKQTPNGENKTSTDAATGSNTEASTGKADDTANAQSSTQKESSMTAKNITAEESKVASQNAAYSRSEAPRSAPAPNQSNRPSHNLPSRPDGPRSTGNRFPERPDSRARPYPEQHGRLDRPADLMQQRYRDQRGLSPAHPDGSLDRRREGPPGDTRDSYNSGDSRQSRSDSRDSRPSPREYDTPRHSTDRTYRDGRESYPVASELGSRPSQASGTASPRPQRSDASLASQERAPLAGQSPDLARDDRGRPPPSQSSPYDRPPDVSGSSRHLRPVEQTTRSTRSSRPSSPGRRDAPSSYSSREEERRDDRSRYPPPDESRQFAQDRSDQRTDQAPSGPRSIRQPSRQTEPMQPPPSSRNSSDYNHSRPSQEYSRPSRYQDSNYGRLNQEQASPPSPHRTTANTGRNEVHSQSKIPAGPGGGLSFSAEQNRSDRGPASSEPATGSSSAPAPAATDRSIAEGGGVHPDRISIIDKSQPPSLKIPPPAGPRSSQSRGAETPTSSTTLPSPTSRNAPTGPADSRRHGVRQFAGIQATLQQGNQPSVNAPNGSGDRGTSIRGRATQGRPGQESAAAVAATGPSNGPGRYPAPSGSNGPPPSPQQHSRSEHPPPRESDSIRRDAPPPPRETRASERDRERQPERPYHRSSRNASPERTGPSTRSGGAGSNIGPGDKSRVPGGDYGRERERDRERDRDPRGGGRMELRDRDRDRREPEYPPHEQRHPRGPPPPSSSSMPGGDGVNGQGGRWQSDRAPPSRGGGSMRGDERSRDMGARKRSWGGDHLEGPGQGESKRPRRTG